MLIDILQVVMHMIHHLLFQCIGLQVGQPRGTTTQGNVFLRNVMLVDPVAAHPRRPR